MTISLKLEDSDREKIERQLASGRFPDASAVVSAGLDLLEQLNDARDHWIDNDMPRRFADAEENPQDLISGDDLFSRLEARHRDRSKGR